MRVLDTRRRWSHRVPWLVWPLLATLLCVAPARHAMAEAQSTSACVVPTQETAKELMARWNAALKTQHPDRVTRLFATDGDLLGFASPVVRASYMTIRDYYLYFVQFEPQVQVTSSHVEAGCNYLIESGTYTWLLKSKSTGVTETRDARFRFIYELMGGQWKVSQYVDALAAETDADSSFAVPPPSAPRLAAGIRGVAPAVAGFLKRAEPAVRATTGSPALKSRPPKAGGREPEMELSIR